MNTTDTIENRILLTIHIPILSNVKRCQNGRRQKQRQRRKQHRTKEIRNQQETEMILPIQQNRQNLEESKKETEKDCQMVQIYRKQVTEINPEELQRQLQTKSQQSTLYGSTTTECLDAQQIECDIQNILSQLENDKFQTWMHSTESIEKEILSWING